MGKTSRAESLVERADELKRLGLAIEAAQAGAGDLVILEGPAGIGKSSLLEATAQRAATGDGSTGIRLLTACGNPAESELGFGVVLQLLSTIVGERNQRKDGLEIGPSHQAIAPLFDEAALARDADSDAGARSSLAVLHGLHELVRRLCAESPLIMMVDDLQWSDPASIRFISYLAQRRTGLALSLILAIRTGEPGADEESLEALRSDRDTAILVPAPLTERGVSEVVGRSLPEAAPAFTHAIAEATAGNPWFVKAMVRQAIDERIPSTKDGAAQLSGLTPPELRRELVARLNRLPDAERRLAQAAAALGDGAELHQAAAVAELEPEQARAAADCLLARDIFDQVTPLSFSHPLVAEAIRTGLGEAEYAHLQLAAARALINDHAPAQKVAIHLLHALPGREQWVVEALLEASTEARIRGATESAAAYLERALREGGGLERRAEILFQLGLAEATAGRVRGLELISTAAVELETPEDRAFALIRLGWILGIRSLYKASTEVFAAARDALGETDSELAWAAEAGEVMSGTQYPPTRKRYRQRLERLLLRPDLETFPIGRNVLGFAALEQILVARPRQEALTYVERILKTDPKEVELDGSAYRMAAMALAMCGEPEASERISSRLEELSLQQGSSMELSAIVYPRLLAAIERGRLDELTRLAQRALDEGHLGWGIRVVNAASALAFARLEADDQCAAADALVSVGDESTFSDALLFPIWLETRGLIALAADDAEAALADFERAGRLREESGFITPALSWLGWRSGAALAHARLDRRKRALRLATDELALATRSATPRAIGNAQRTVGLVSEGEIGLKHLRDAVATHRASPSLLEQARSLIELGSALRRQGQRRGSREPLKRGLELARRCGATRLARRAEEELRASGARLGGRPLSGVGALTPAELRVALLAASGLSNRQIATRLYLSRKTVEHHLGRSYRKLAITSREQLDVALAGTRRDQTSAGRGSE